MLSRFRHSRANIWIVAFYALAMATLGLAHRPAGAAVTQPAIDLAAYAAPDGTLPVICLTEHGQPGSSTSAAGHCDACALSNAPGLAAAPQIGQPVVVAQRIARRIDPAGQFSPAPRRGPTSRGPPLA